MDRISNRIMIVPDPVRQKIATLGAEGKRWLIDLSDLIGELEQEWQLIVGSALPGGSEAYVVQVRTREGLPAILKVAIPEATGNTVLAHEITALTLADGHGYVRLLRSDLRRRALVLERLGNPLRELGYSTRTQIDIICTTLRDSWMPISSGSRLPSGASMAKFLSNFIADLWEQLDRPCSRRALETALSFAQTRAKVFDNDRATLLVQTRRPYGSGESCSVCLLDSCSCGWGRSNRASGCSRSPMRGPGHNLFLSDS